MESPKAIIFHLLTALLDSWSTWNTAAGSSEAGRRWRARYLEITFGCGPYQTYEDLVRQAARDAGLPETAPTALLQNWDSLKPWDEVSAVLKKLKEKGYRLGVITNCSRSLGHRACEQVGVDFDVVLTAEEVGSFYKPDPRAYASVIDAFNLKASDVFFVAGSSGDVVGAAEAGMKVIWHNHVGLPARPGSNPILHGRTLKEALVDFL
ncbi:HAD-superfamily hydrolase, subfamily IA, variant 2 [Tothia fuscella]|uniref:HAD-superfamily hydrolase, subfamily IA, variant 2 n=1 Tax=Tothia fuscella TaxID=1048955 RepID=A0A9P4NJB1_9PEZI|nr:HAD-superfamily hydrolase, subfamily IA, variant 2 [Tothia fuscella]